MALASVGGRLALALLAAVQLVPGQVAPEQGPGAWERILEFHLEGALSAASSLDAEMIARRYLEDHVRQKGVTYSLDGRSSSFDGGVEHLTFTPRVAGIPYFDASAQVHVDRQGRVVRFEAPGSLALPKDLVFQADARRAGQAALQDWAGSKTALLREGLAKSDGEQRTVLYSELAAAPLIASRTWFDAAGQARAAWTVYVEPNDGLPHQVVIDAETEQALYKRSLVQEAEPDGYVFPAPETQNPAEGPYALRFLSGRRDARGACPPPIYPSGAGTAGLCWTNGSATVGNNVDACADRDGNDVCDGRALGSAGRFLYPFLDAYQTASDAAADLSAALVNAFYWTNVAHDWLYELGFDETSGNFQQDNFGRGGYGNDRVRVDVQDGAVSNNAWFATPPDGLAPRMQLGLWPSARRDGAFDGDIILHEYVHGLTNRLIGGPLDIGGLFLWQSGGMGEGWSDVLSASFTDDPVIGEYATKNASTGIRTVRYDQNPLTFGQFGVRRLAVLPGTNTLAGLPAVHRDGEIWASALWDVRQALGREASNASSWPRSSSPHGGHPCSTPATQSCRRRPWPATRRPKSVRYGTRSPPVASAHRPPSTRSAPANGQIRR